MGLCKEDAEVIEALIRWMESQNIRPEQAFIAMSALCAVIIGKASRDEDDVLEGIACCAKDMIELGIAAHRKSREKL